MRVVTNFIADDGKVFETKEACEAHEASSFALQFAGLTLDQVNAALSRENTKLANAFEVIGRRIADTRREGGEMRRKPKGAAEPKPGTPAPGTDETTPAPSEAVVVVPPPSETVGVVGKAVQVVAASDAVLSAAFERGRQDYRDGKPEAIPGGLKESEWDDWIAGYAHEEGRRELQLDGEAA